MKKSCHYSKVYTVEINRITKESGSWYYSHKGEIFNCVLIIKENFDSTVSSIHFLVLDRKEDELVPPTIIRTIRQLDCQVIAEHITDSKPIFEIIQYFGGKNEKRLSDLRGRSESRMNKINI
jgi:hypothetical protein